MVAALDGADFASPMKPTTHRGSARLAGTPSFTSFSSNVFKKRLQQANPMMASQHERPPGQAKSNMLPKGPLNPLLASGKQPITGPTLRESGDISHFQPPANDFYNKAERLSIWSKSDAQNLFIDAHSESGSDMDDVSVRKLSENESFVSKARTNSIAGMSQGSFASSASKSIRSRLGGKFM